MELLKPYAGDNSLHGLPPAVGISLALHLLFLLLLGIRSTPPGYTERTIRVSLAPPMKAVSKPISDAPTPSVPMSQLVSPSEAPERAPTVPTRFKSDRDTSAVREQVKRGDGAPSLQPDETKHVPPEKPRSQPPVPTPATTKPQTLGSLRLTDKALRERILSDVSPSKTASGPESRAERLSSYKPFSKANSVSSGLPGIPDYLPGIPDGDITLLNAKADRFAVFVRRVAVQVFGALRSTHWREVPYSEVQRLSEMTTVKATLSKAGKLLKVEILESSGSRAFDNALEHAVQTGAWDQNPPEAAAAEDGNIQFLFRSQTWARRGPEGVGEQRWLLLATGLQ